MARKSGELNSNNEDTHTSKMLPGSPSEHVRSRPIPLRQNSISGRDGAKKGSLIYRIRRADSFNSRASEESYSPEGESLVPECEFDVESIVKIFGEHFHPFQGNEHQSAQKKYGSKRSQSVSSGLTYNRRNGRSSQALGSSSSSGDDKLEKKQGEGFDDESSSESSEGLGDSKSRPSAFDLAKERASYNIASTADKAIQLFSKLKVRKRANSHSGGDGFSTPSQAPVSRKESEEGERASYHTLIKDSVFLGQQPLSNQKHPFLTPNGKHPTYKLNEELLGGGVSEGSICALVCTIQKSFEMGGSFVNNNSAVKPITHNIFAEHNIANIWMHMQDEQGKLNFEMALYRLYDLMEAFLNGIPIYVHCKSGKGRSVMFVILLFSFCFLSWHYEEKCQKDKKSGEDDTVSQSKMERLQQVIQPIISATCDNEYREDCNEIMRSFASTDKPSKEVLQLLVSVCERYMKSIRTFINLGHAKRESSLEILKILVERIHGKENTAHSSFKSPDCAFLDDLGQSAVFKNISIYMAGSKYWGSPECGSFQRFLNHLVKNKGGWFAELNKVCQERGYARENTCSHFANTDRSRREMVKSFKDEIISLSEKHPGSNYSQVVRNEKGCSEESFSTKWLSQKLNSKGSSESSQQRMSQSDRESGGEFGSKGSIPRIQRRLGKSRSGSISSGSPSPAGSRRGSFGKFDSSPDLSRLSLKKEGSKINKSSQGSMMSPSWRRKKERGPSTNDRKVSEGEIKGENMLAKPGNPVFDISTLLNAEARKPLKESMGEGSFSMQMSGIDSSSE